ncbi:hypothetical protein NE857_32275 [Nocardiopsis exhalans]|uniref:Uncharacterized protein n=2 Tax=Nocardiopsis exhalans TaxID=163604 RepID=A0ABY5D765_9ACTN|nr:hypothetical protein [Nocardiopsis exhalans]USY19852.1 hypothetical protein NE857_32275 [Nocardiopsis exhalans]
MNMLLLVRSVDDVRSAVENVSDYLVNHRRQFGDEPGSNRLLGVWIRPELEAGLPVSYAEDTDAAPSQSHTGKAVWIERSFSLAGIWTLCWMDGPALRETPDPFEWQNRILDSLVAGPVPEPGSPEVFVPVFAEGDAVETSMTALRARQPHLITEHWYVHDREHGIVGPLKPTEE